MKTKLFSKALVYTAILLVLFSSVLFSCKKDNQTGNNDITLSPEDQIIKTEIERLTELVRKSHNGEPYEKWEIQDVEESSMIVQNTLNYWHSRATGDAECLIEYTTIPVPKDKEVLKLFIQVKEVVSAIYLSQENLELEFVSIGLTENKDSLRVQSTFSIHNKQNENSPKPLYSFPNSNGYMPYTMSHVLSSQFSRPNIGFVYWDLHNSKELTGSVTNSSLLDYNGSTSNLIVNVFKDLFNLNARYHFNRVTRTQLAYLYSTYDRNLTNPYTTLASNVFSYHTDIYGAFPSSYSGIIEPFCFYFAGTGEYNYSLGGCQVADWNADPELEKKSWLSAELMDFYLQNIFYMAEKHAYRDSYVTSLVFFDPLFQSTGQCYSNTHTYNDYLGIRLWRINCRYKYKTGLVTPLPQLPPPSYNY